MSAPLFEAFRKSLSVRNTGDISTSYGEITNRLNKDFWDGLESSTTHCRQVGSYGRNTAIHGVSDLDMVFELPAKVLERFKKVQGNGPSQLLQEVKSSIKERYPRTKIRGDGQVVVVEFDKFCVEVLPAFYNAEDSSYTYGDTNDGGSWCKCKPIQEIDAFNERNNTSNRNLKRVCKMLRAWKDSQGSPMSGMLIDTLTYGFFKVNTGYDSTSYASYPELVRDIFAYLANLPNQDYWIAPGSNQRVDCTGKFQRKAKSAALRCQEAIDAEKEKTKVELWQKVFGTRFFPYAVSEGRAFKSSTRFNNTEEFIEDKFPLRIRYELEIDCDVGQDATSLRTRWLRGTFPWLNLGRRLHFRVVHSNVPQPDAYLWKIRNVGPEAERRGIRGQIVTDAGYGEKFERTDFHGPHFVECYAIKDGYCVARDRIDVPIGTD